VRELCSDGAISHLSNSLYVDATITWVLSARIPYFVRLWVAPSGHVFLHTLASSLIAYHSYAYGIALGAVLAKVSILSLVS